MSIIIIITIIIKLFKYEKNKLPFKNQKLILLNLKIRGNEFLKIVSNMSIKVSINMQKIRIQKVSLGWKK